MHPDCSCARDHLPVVVAPVDDDAPFLRWAFAVMASAFLAFLVEDVRAVECLLLGAVLYAIERLVTEVRRLRRAAGK